MEDKHEKALRYIKAQDKRSIHSVLWGDIKRCSLYTMSCEDTERYLEKLGLNAITDIDINGWAIDFEMHFAFHLSVNQYCLFGSMYYGKTYFEKVLEKDRI